MDSSKSDPKVTSEVLTYLRTLYNALDDAHSVEGDKIWEYRDKAQQWRHATHDNELAERYDQEAQWAVEKNREWIREVCKDEVMKMVKEMWEYKKTEVTTAVEESENIAGETAGRQRG